MQMKDLASSCRGGAGGAPGPCHRDRLPQQGPYISEDRGPGSTRGARAAQEDGRGPSAVAGQVQRGLERAVPVEPGRSSRADCDNSSRETPVHRAPWPDAAQGCLWPADVSQVRNRDK